MGGRERRGEVGFKGVGKGVDDELRKQGAYTKCKAQWLESSDSKGNEMQIDLHKLAKMAAFHVRCGTMPCAFLYATILIQTMDKIVPRKVRFVDCDIRMHITELNGLLTSLFCDFPLQYIYSI